MDRIHLKDGRLAGDGRERVREARILCCITFHFVRTRLESLADVLEALADFPVAALDVVIVTNAIDDAEGSMLRRLTAEILDGGRATIHRVDDLAHPFDLAWRHKEVLAGRFLGAEGEGYTHFVYLEDDIRFTFENFRYFVEAREQLRDAGLLPAFVRAEWSHPAGGLVATDLFWPVYVPVQPQLRVGELVFTNLPNPYNPCYVLDRALAAEHAASLSFDSETSGRVMACGVRERAAMGLCLDNAPKPFRWRYVVPVTRTNAVPSWARVRHLIATYATEPQTGLGKTRLDSLFVGAERTTGTAWWPRLDEPDDSPRFLLVTHHDTIVYFDWASMQLQHGPLGIVPFNLTVALADGGAVLTAAAEGGKSHRLEFGCESVGEGWIGLKRDHLYASAQGYGGVRVDRPAMSDWEIFGLMRCDTVSGIGLLAGHLWTSDADGSTVYLEPQPIAFARWQASPASALAAGIVRNASAVHDGITFGGARIRLVTRKPQLAFGFEELGGKRLPTRVLIVDHDGNVSSFSRKA
jgi:hypothetical protein